MQPFADDMLESVDTLVASSRESILCTTPNTVVIGELIARIEALERAVQEASRAIQQLTANTPVSRSND